MDTKSRLSVLKRARDLARTGRYPDLDTLAVALAFDHGMTSAWRCMENPIIKHELEAIIAETRSFSPAALS